MCVARNVVKNKGKLTRKEIRMGRMNKYNSDVDDIMNFNRRITENILNYLNQERNIPEVKEDCYFYEDEKDMNATITTCTYYDKIGFPPCDGCKKYIHKSTVKQTIKEFVDKGFIVN